MLTRLFRLITGDVVPQLMNLIDIATRVLNSNLQMYTIVMRWQNEIPLPDLKHTWFELFGSYASDISNYPIIRRLNWQVPELRYYLI